MVQKLTCCLTRSLLIYIGTPMVVAGLWMRQDIDSLEAGLYRKILFIGNGVSNKAISTPCSASASRGRRSNI